MEGPLPIRPTIVICASGNTGAALRDPKLQQSGQTGHGQESQSCPNPAEVTSTAGIRDDSADHGDAGPHWSDDIANPVNEVQERAFRLRPGLTLDRNVDLRRSAKILSESCQWRRAKGPLWQRHMGPRRQGSMSAKAPAAFDGHADLLTALGRAREK